MHLETERLLIRDFTQDDFAAVYAYGSDPEVLRYMDFPPGTPESTRDHITRCMSLAREQPRQNYDLGVVLKTSGHLIGGITLSIINPATGEAAFSYLFNRAYWGYGYATEALERIVSFAFEELALAQMADTCDIANTASARVMEKCGFRCEDERDGERFYVLRADEWQRLAASR